MTIRLWWTTFTSDLIRFWYHGKCSVSIVGVIYVIHMDSIVMSAQNVRFRGCSSCVWTYRRELCCIDRAITSKITNTCIMIYRSCCKQWTRDWLHDHHFKTNMCPRVIKTANLTVFMINSTWFRHNTHCREIFHYFPLFRWCRLMV